MALAGAIAAAMFYRLVGGNRAVQAFPSQPMSYCATEPAVTVLVELANPGPAAVDWVDSYWPARGRVLCH